MHINAAQCRAARALLGWSRDALAAHAKVGKRTIVDFEREARAPHESTRIALRLAFEVAGIEIIESNGGGAGVRFKEQR